MGKLYETLGLAQYEAEKISSSPRDWLHYLDTASQLYRYPFSASKLHTPCFFCLSIWYLSFRLD